MPDIFDQIHARDSGAPGVNPPPVATGAPKASGDIFDRIHAQRASTPPPQAPAAAAVSPDDPDHAGFWHSFYNETAGPIVDMIHDSINRGDLGEKAASDILDAFSSQLKTFAAHPDIRNLPLIGPGATATAARMQRQYNEGNYKGMIGTAAGFVGAMVAPEAHAAIVEKLPAAAQAAAQWGEAAGAGAKAGAEAAAPDLAAAARKGAYSAILDRFVPDPVRGLVHLGEGAVSVGQAARGVYRGAKAARAAYQDVRAAQAAGRAAEEATAAAEAAARARGPRVPVWQKAYDDAAAARAAEEAGTPAGETPATEPPAAAAPPTDFESAPDARDSLTPEMQQRADEVREQVHTPGAAAEPEPAGADVSIGVPEAAVPALTPAQRLRDAIDQHAAYLRMQADDVTWGNRARQAEQYASWFVKNKLEVTPENLQRAANELEPRAISKRTGLPLGPSEVPGEETADMIADRVDWRNARQAANGPHGPILENFQHDARGAIDELRRRQSGDAIGALYHPEIGDIDLIWGKAGNPERDFKGGYGLAHIDAKHPGIAEQLADIVPTLEKGPIRLGNRQLLIGKDHTAVVGLDWNDEAKRWLLTAYEEKTPRPEELLRGSGRVSVEDPATPRGASLPDLSVNQEIPSAMEQQLTASIEAVNSKRGKQATAEPGHVESKVPQSAPEPGRSVDTGGAGGRPPVAAQSTTGSGAQGERTAVDVPGEQRAYPAQYSVRELSDVQPSHLGETFQPNPQYQFENDRLYDDPRNQRKIVDWSTKAGFKPRNLLNTAPSAELGPPIVDAAGNVLGGNGRTMILQRVYKSNPEGAAAYRAELDRTAAHYGIHPASYAGMKQPVLVREIDPEILKDEATAQRAVTDFNKTGTAALTPSERAIADAKGVSQRTLDDIGARMDRLGPDATLAQTVEGRQGIEVLRNLERDGVISPQEGAELATETKLTKQGKERISGLMLGRWFEDAKQMDALPDSLRNKLERMTAPLARAETVEGYSLQPTIKEALNILEDAEAHGVSTLDDYLQQGGLFSEREFSPAAVAFAKALKSTNPIELTHAARKYAERAKYAEEYQGPGMFGDIPAPMPPAEAFSNSFEHLAK